MKSLASLLIIGLMFTSSFAQNPVNSGNARDGLKVTRENLKGTPFIIESWVTGYGISSNGNKTNTMMLNYDIYGDQLVYKDDSGQVMSMVDTDLSGFVITTLDGVQIFAKTQQFEFKNGNTPDMAYVNVYDGAARNILVEHFKELDDPNLSGWSSSKNNTLNAEYKAKMNVYVVNPEGTYEKIKLKNKSLLSIYNDHPKLKNFLKNNKINTLNDLDQAFKYINANLAKK
ncbi:hypothetical protein [Gelidibacter sediminis]|nr:hypothetical protein [Gelidibacter sediminis]